MFAECHHRMDSRDPKGHYCLIVSPKVLLMYVRCRLEIQRFETRKHIRTSSSKSHTGPRSGNLAMARHITHSSQSILPLRVGSNTMNTSHWQNDDDDDHEESFSSFWKEENHEDDEAEDSLFYEPQRYEPLTRQSETSQNRTIYLSYDDGNDNDDDKVGDWKEDSHILKDSPAASSDRSIYKPPSISKPSTRTTSRWRQGILLLLRYSYNRYCNRYCIRIAVVLVLAFLFIPVCAVLLTRAFSTSSNESSGGCHPGSIQQVQTPQLELTLAGFTHTISDAGQRQLSQAVMQAYNSVSRPCQDPYERWMVDAAVKDQILVHFGTPQNMTTTGETYRSSLVVTFQIKISCHGCTQETAFASVYPTSYQRQNQSRNLVVQGSTKLYPLPRNWIRGDLPREEGDAAAIGSWEERRVLSAVTTVPSSSSSSSESELNAANIVLAIDSKIRSSHVDDNFVGITSVSILPADSSTVAMQLQAGGGKKGDQKKKKGNGNKVGGSRLEPCAVNAVPTRGSATKNAKVKGAPTAAPTGSPSCAPSSAPRSTEVTLRIKPPAAPTTEPSLLPSSIPTSSPAPSSSPTRSASPSTSPSLFPSTEPSSSSSPSTQPSKSPMPSRSSAPTGSPSNSNVPSMVPSREPSRTPTSTPSLIPSTEPSSQPSGHPTLSAQPSAQPSTVPSEQPSTAPSSNPSTSSEPSAPPSQLPSQGPTITCGHPNQPCCASTLARNDVLVPDGCIDKTTDGLATPVACYSGTCQICGLSSSPCCPKGLIDTERGAGTAYIDGCFDFDGAASRPTVCHAATCVRCGVAAGDVCCPTVASSGASSFFIPASEDSNDDGCANVVPGSMPSVHLTCGSVRGVCKATGS